MNIQHKIMFLFVGLVSGIILLLAASVYYFSALERRVVFDKRLKSRANFSAQLYTLLGDSAYASLNQEDTAYAVGLLPDRTIAIFPDGKGPIYQFAGRDSSRFDLGPLVSQTLQSQGEVYFKIGDREAFAVRKEAPAFIVVVAARDSDGLDRLGELLRILGVSLLIAILASALVGRLFARQLVRPIEQVIADVKDITSKNLSARIHTGSTQDELSRLAGTFNDLLERLQTSFELQKNFISNASHELSTPLTSVSSQLEVALQLERSPESYKAVLLSVYEDVRLMRRLTQSLLELARTSSVGPPDLAEIRMDEILLKIVPEVRTLSPNYRMDLNFGDFPEDERDCLLFGNAELLHSAVRNVVENGCKYSADGQVYVDLSFPAHQVVVRVRSRGALIEPGEIKRIFEPFYRGRLSRDTRGSGLGLALAAAIVRLHKGQIKVSSDEPAGTEFEFAFPSLGVPF